MRHQGFEGVCADAAQTLTRLARSLSIGPVLLECPHRHPWHLALRGKVSCHRGSGFGFSHSLASAMPRIRQARYSPGAKYS